MGTKAVKAGTANAAPAVVAAVNGPEDDVTDWLSIDWQQVDDDVRRLRQRIFTASQAGDLKRVRNLQKLMVRHEARRCRTEVEDLCLSNVVAVERSWRKPEPGIAGEGGSSLDKVVTVQNCRMGRAR
ncbi:reverse transcriptase N-terminal domain-containing protein [Streptomyces sp. NPDC002845]